ncbi:arylesterase [Alteromonas sp. 5E99-2]|uniref:arylesterase n=1 Tax=Alteromonas sp. 5E99-2 TaxID=2817683 RepID=UPI001F618E11|nr:arylesterase [Alteromonas sp. 5E99-2]
MSSASAENKTTKLLIVGDSLSAAYGLLSSEGWVTLLENKYKQSGFEIDVVNAAISGDTTQGSLSRLPRLLEKHQPTHVFLELGGNDGLRGQNIQDMRKNLAKMITLIQQAGAQVFLQDMEIPSNYGSRYTQLFGDSYDILAKDNDLILFPFFLADIALDKSLMQNDGIHPNKAAQPIIADLMYKRLSAYLPAEPQN